MKKLKVNSSEEKVINKAEEFYYNSLLKGDTTKATDEYESLLKSYKKLSKRYMKTIKMSDSEQHRSFSENEKTKGDMKKLKSHAISKISDGMASQSKIKEEFSKELATKNLHIKKLKEELQELKKEVDKFNTSLRKHDDKNKELINKISMSEKQNFTFEYLLEKEMSQANVYKYEFSLVMIGIDDLVQLKKELKTRSNVDTVISALSRFFNSSIKKFDLVKYMDGGLFYILFHHTKDESVNDFVKRISAKKKMGSSNIKFRTGYATYEDGNNIDRFMNQCLIEFNDNTQQMHKTK